MACEAGAYLVYTRKARGFAAGGQWMYAWFSMTTVRNFFYRFYNDWHEENMLYEIEI